MKKFLAALALSLLTLTPAAFAADTPAPAKPVIKIGVSAALTGNNAHLGENIRNALILAQENLPQNTKFEYHLVFEDSALESKKAAISANKMINVDKVDALVSHSPAAGGAISPIAEQSKVVHFNIGLAQSVAEGAYNFIHWNPPQEQARVMADELEKRGIKRVAIIKLNQSGPIELISSLSPLLIKKGIEIVFEDTINSGETDFRTSIVKAKATNPEIYIILFFTPELEIIAKQIREAGIQKPITSMFYFSASKTPEVFEGEWYVDAADASKGFNEKFETRFGKVPEIMAPNAYDIVNILVQGFETATVAPDAVDGKPTQEAVVEALHKIDMDGMLGRLTMDEKGVVFSPAAVKIIKNGKPVAIENAL